MKKSPEISTANVVGTSPASDRTDGSASTTLSRRWRAIAAGTTLLALAGCTVGGNAAPSSSTSEATTATSSPEMPIETNPDMPGHEGKIPAPDPVTTIAPNLLVNRNVPLDASTLCTWRLGEHPMPLSNQQPPKVKIDDRCNYPQNPDPKMDSPTGIYKGTQQIHEQLATAVPDGTELTIECYYPDGQKVSDGVGNASNTWLHVTGEYNGQFTGNIPNVNVGGGYSDVQLYAMQVPPCG